MSPVGHRNVWPSAPAAAELGMRWFAFDHPPPISLFPSGRPRNRGVAGWSTSGPTMMLQCRNYLLDMNPFAHLRDAARQQPQYLSAFGIGSAVDFSRGPAGSSWPGAISMREISRKEETSPTPPSHKISSAVPAASASVIQNCAIKRRNWKRLHRIEKERAATTSVLSEEFTRNMPAGLLVGSTPPDYLQRETRLQSSC